MNENSIISPDRILQAKRSRFNPLRGLKPELLAPKLDMFKVGYLREAAILWDAIESRDYTLKVVAPKRRNAVARHGYEILAVDDSPEAIAHKNALEYFYNNLTATAAMDENERGGLSLLVRQMMDSVGKKYAVHEIVWEPANSVAGRTGLSATFRFCPLWFFEARTSRLRFLTSEASTEGVEMLDGEWLVTVGDGIMEACSVCYVYKGLSLKDWISFNEKFGMPGIQGKTDAQKGSPEWNNLVTAVQVMMNDWAAVTSRNDEIVLIETKAAAGAVPFQPLVDKMDQAMTSLWRGGDLGTISQKDHAGASLQADESDILEMDDAQRISETLNIQVDRFVIQQQFGTTPKAYIKILTGKKQDVAQELLIDQFLLDSGAPLAVENALERYGREVPDAGDDLLKPTAQKVPISPTGPALENERRAKMIGNITGLDRKPHYTEFLENQVDPKLLDTAHVELAKRLALDLYPVRKRLERILQISDPEIMSAKLKAFQADLPELLKDIIADPASAQIIEDTLSAAMVNGLTQGGGK